jgi:SM-20-related protein
MKQFTFSSGKKLWTFDNLISLEDRYNAFIAMKRSNFQLGWKDTETEEGSKYDYFYSLYNNRDLDNLKVYHTIMNSPVSELVQGMTLSKAIVNLSTPSNVYFLHAHPEKRVILYYANMDWSPNWHGETLFYDEACRDIECAVSYIPGRIAVFDGSVPHTIRPQSFAASQLRFTLSLLFN